MNEAIRKVLNHGSKAVLIGALALSLPSCERRDRVPNRQDYSNTYGTTLRQNVWIVPYLYPSGQEGYTIQKGAESDKSWQVLFRRPLPTDSLETRILDRRKNPYPMTARMEELCREILPLQRELEYLQDSARYATDYRASHK